MKYNGRIYLAKDARMNAEIFNKGYSMVGDFLKIKSKYDPQKKFQSLQSKRLGV